MIAKRRPHRSKSRYGHTRTANTISYRRPLRLEPLEDRRLLALVTVTTDQDVVDFGDGLTSLREAVFATNLVAGADTIDFAESLTNGGHDGPATILLTEGELRITDDLTITGPGAELLTIDASGNDPTPDINNGDGSRVLNIDNRNDEIVLDVMLKGLTLTGGDTTRSGGGIASLENLSLHEVAVTGNAMTGVRQYGGGVYQQSGTLTIQRCRIEFNSTPNYAGGGVSIRGGTLQIDSSVVAGNIADLRAGGIDANDSSLVIEDSRVENNSSRGPGGGIFVQGGSVEIATTTIHGNQAEMGDGGGIYISSDLASIANSTIDRNTGRDGGGIAATTRGSISIVHSTISNNIATNNGGGLQTYAFEAYARILIDRSTITANTSAGDGGGIFVVRGQTALKHSLIAGNSAGDAASEVHLFIPTFPQSPPAQLTTDQSLIGTNADSGLLEAPVNSPDANGNIVGGPVHGVIDPLLGPLADNGGPTFTHALLPGSPAINRGDLNAVAGEEGVPLFDQRGEPFPRIAGGRIDIGAFEYQEPSDLNLLVDTLGDEMDGDHGRGDLSLREAIALANKWPSDDTIRFDPMLFATLGPAPPRIVLTMGEIFISDNDTIDGPGAELLTIDASGNDPTPDQDNGDGSRVFSTMGDRRDPSGGVTIRGLTLTGGDMHTRGGGAVWNTGKLTLEDVVITGNHTLGDGGGVSSPTGTLTIVDSAISGNRARRGGAVSSMGGETVIDSTRFAENTATERGGAVFYFHAQAEGNLKVVDSTFSGNTVLSESGLGGAIYAADSPPPTSEGVNQLTITGNTITGNTARGGGAGIFARMTKGSVEFHENDVIGNVAGNPFSRGGGILLELTTAASELTSNTLRENSAGRGGGVYVVSFTASGMQSTVLIDDSAISANTATSGESEGGGVVIFGQSLPTQNITTTIRNSMIEGNRSAGGFGRGGGISVTAGPLTIESSTISGNSASRFGGGVFARGALMVVDSTIAGNEAQRGGGIDVMSESQSVEIAGSEFVGNKTTGEMGHGGAIHHQGGRLTVTDSEFVENTASGSGGGIYIAAGSSVIDHTEFRGNSAAMDGGGIASFAFAGRGVGLEVIASHFANNRAGRDGGGLLVSGRNVVVSSSLFDNNEAGENGGGIGVQGGPFTLINSTLSGNSAGAFGGGMWTMPAVTVAHSTIHQNEAAEAGGGVFVASGTLNLSNSIVAGNTAIPNGPDIGGFLGATINPRFSLIGSNVGSGIPQTVTGMPDANGNLIGGGSRIDPRLGPLADNGGETFTHALLPESPAINAGDPAAQPGVNGVPVHDQRGEPFIRVFGGRIDMGAFERLPGGFLPGDFNRDSIVDAADYVLWRSDLGMTVDPGTGADGNGDGIVDARDHAVWTSNFMSTTADLGFQVPPRGLITTTEAAEEFKETFAMTLAPRFSSREARVVPVESRSADARLSTVASRRDNALVAWLASAAADEADDEARQESPLRRRVDRASGYGDANEHESRDRLTRAVDRAFEAIGTHRAKAHRSGGF